jgi:hypothetical protein
LIGGDGAVRDHHRGAGLALGQTHAREQAVRKLAVGVLHHGTHTQGARAGVDPVVQEVDLRFVVEALFAGKRDVGERIVGAAELHRPRLVHVDVDVQRVDRHHGRQRRGQRRPHQVARRDQHAADAPADRRAHVGVLQVERGAVDVGAHQRPARRQLAHLRTARVPLLLGDGAALVELVGAAELLVRELEVDPRRFELRLGACQGGFVGTRVDHEQQVSLLDLVAFMKGCAREVAVGARANFDRIRRLGATGVLTELGHRGDGGLGDGDLGPRRTGRRVCTLHGVIATGGCQCEQRKGGSA